MIPVPSVRFDPALDPRAFRQSLGAFATGVTVVTTRDAQGVPVGITANSFASVSLDPPLVLWSPAKASRRFGVFAAAGTFSIHVLSASQQDVCDGFVRHAWPLPPPDGEPWIGGVLARFDCRREAVIDAGDHAVILGRVVQAERRDGAPLIFHGGRYGHFADGQGGHPQPEGGA